MSTAPDNDDLKRAEEIAEATESILPLTSTKMGADARKDIIKESFLEALSEERARTLNSEAVQGLMEFLRHDNICNTEVDRPCDCGYENALKQFQQYALNNSAKDGK